jgi:hypothetical protein
VKKDFFSGKRERKEKEQGREKGTCQSIKMKANGTDL